MVGRISGLVHVLADIRAFNRVKSWLEEEKGLERKLSPFLQGDSNWDFTSTSKRKSREECLVFFHETSNSIQCWQFRQTGDNTDTTVENPCTNLAMAPTPSSNAGNSGKPPLPNKSKKFHVCLKSTLW